MREISTGGQKPDRQDCPMTLKEFYIDLVNTLCWSWIASWWPPGDPSSVIVQTPDQTWDAKNANAPCPSDIQAFGWNGSDTQGRLIWVGFDFDIGHGAEQYASTDLAMSDAYRVRHFFKGRAEIRFSRSGEGLHVRHRLPADTHRPASDGPLIAKGINTELKLKADPTALGRQAFWCWTHESTPNAFRLVQQHRGIEYD